MSSRWPGTGSKNFEAIWGCVEGVCAGNWNHYYFTSQEHNLSVWVLLWGQQSTLGLWLSIKRKPRREPSW